MSVRERRLGKEPPELNITAFLNLMVVLIPFLLLSAAFNHLSVLELFLPVQSEAESIELPDTKTPDLELIVYQGLIKLNDKNAGEIISTTWEEDIYPAIEILQAELIKIKAKYPVIKHIVILAQKDTSYEELVTLMDNVRTVVVDDGEKRSLRELFPDIALGDAPELDEAS